MSSSLLFDEEQLIINEGMALWSAVFPTLALSFVILLGTLLLKYKFDLEFNLWMAVSLGASVALFPLHCSSSLPIIMTGASPTMWNVPLYTFTYDMVYYFLHRVHHQYFPMHIKVHHKPLRNALQAMEFEPIELLSVHALLLFVRMILPIPPLGTFVFFTFLFVVSTVSHTGWDLDYPIVISPADHKVHHNLHVYNYGSMFKIFDQAFGTYHRAGKKKNM